jgi:uncharacterized protein YhaN
LKNLDDVNIFYGINEAGKSTIMSFIHSVLFGFPTKQQSELRYEPKKLTKYGGQLIVTFPSGKAVIERVKGKATGDVKVVLEDGALGGEELLKELLSNMDKNLFQSIFSFNLHGLQNVQQMKNEDLGKFLFSTGTLGTDKLLYAETALQKQLDSHYKPNGKKPAINEKINEIKHLYQDVKKAEQQNDQYWQYLEKRDSLEKRISQLSQQSVIIKNQIAKLEELKRLFPVINSMSSRIKSLENEMGKLLPNDDLLANELTIYTAVENLPLYEQMKQEKNQISLALKDLREEIFDLQQKLHLSVDEHQVLKSNTSVFMKEKTTNAQRLDIRLKEKKLELDEEFEQSKQELEELEDQLKKVDAAILPDTKREELREQKNSAENRHHYLQELSETQSQKKMFQKLRLNEEQKEKAQKKQMKYQIGFFSLILVFLAGWGIINQQWVILVVALAGFVYLLLFQRKKPPIKGNDFQSELTAFEEKEKTLESKLNSASKTKIEELIRKLDEDNRIREKQRMMKLKWEQKNEQYEKLLLSYDKWDQEMRNHKNLLLDLGSEIGIPKEIAITNVHDAFLLVEKLKDKMKEKKKLAEREQIIIAELAKIENRINDLADRFLTTQTLQLQNKAYLLKQELKKHQELQIQNQEKEIKLNELKMESQQYVLEKERLKEFTQLEDLEEQLNLLHGEIKQCEAGQGELQEQLAEVRYQIQTLEDGGTYAELLHRYKLKQFELKEDAKNWARFAIAKDILEQAVERYKNQRLPKMIEKAEGYLCFLTDGHYIRIHTQKEGSSLLIESQDHTIFEPNELSQATSEQIYVSLRLALATTLYEKYQFPIIIDDSFVNFDHIRTQKVIELLGTLTSHQILFFTCHQHLLGYFTSRKVIEISDQAHSPLQK